MVLDVDDTLCLAEAVCFELGNRVLSAIGRDPMTRLAHLTTWGMPDHRSRTRHRRRLLQPIDALGLHMILDTDDPDFISTHTTRVRSDVDQGNLRRYRPTPKHVRLVS